MARDIVPEVLTGKDNYANWRVWMKNYFVARDDDIWDEVMERIGDPPKLEESEVEFRAWKKKNAAALHAIQVSCSFDILSLIRDVTSAKDCWHIFALAFEPKAPLGSNPQVDDDQGTKESEYAKFLPLCKAIEKGDLDAVKSFLGLHKDAINQKISEYGSTALHLATSKGNIELVEELLELMSDEGVEITNNDQCTALSTAAVIGATKIAELLVKKNKKLVSIPAGLDLPVITACICGHKDTTIFLYSQTPFELLVQENGKYGALLLHVTLSSEMLDVSLDLVRRCSTLATTRTFLSTTPLIEFAHMHDLFPSGCKLVFWKRWIYSYIQVQLLTSPCDMRIPIILQNRQMQQESSLARVLYQFRNICSRLLLFFGLKQIYDLKLKHSFALALIQCISEDISTLDDREREKRRVYDAFFDATDFGIIEVVTAIIEANPNLLYAIDSNLWNIIHCAVRNRQEKIFNLIYAIGERKHTMIYQLDGSKNNLLHLAAMLAPPNRLASIPGAALRMQRELQWYKEVESIVNPALKRHANKDGLTPRQLFTHSHKQLMTEGEKWMKEVARSCTVVGALMIVMTIMFCAAVTITGGTIEESGFPIFSHTRSFEVFIISDAISLFSSSTSVVTFLGVLTSRYAEEDFLESLPRKLIIGLSTLTFSVAAMMVSFCATLIIMIDGNLNHIIPTMLLASIPVTVFILLQFPLLVEIFISTYGPSIFDRKNKYWYLAVVACFGSASAVVFHCFCCCRMVCSLMRQLFMFPAAMWIGR